jgi:putative phage-type endonuclease
MLTALQHEQRKLHIGASDMPAILGLSPWMSAMDVWLLKTGKVKPEDTENAAADIGSALEPYVLKLAEDGLGPIETRDKKGNPFFIVDPRDGILAATLDGRVKETGLCVEAKCRGIFRPMEQGWGEPGTDDVPKDILVQASVQMICTVTLSCHIAAILGGRGYQLYHAELDSDVAAMLMEKAYKFWQCVTTDTPPDDSIASLEMIKRITREPKSIKPEPIDDKYIVAYEEAKQRAKIADTVKEEAQSALLTQLGTFEAARYSQGLVTYPQQVSRKETHCPACQHKLSDTSFCHKLYLKTDKK